MSLSNLKPSLGARKKAKRVGRGPGSGHGKTSCRGQKGQRSRTGGGVPPWFEGGQMPLIRLLPKRGFNNARFRTEYTIINLREIAAKFSEGAVVDLEALKEARLIKGRSLRVKVLGEGEISFPITLKVHKASRSAQEKIRAAGGQVELLEG
ncbi:50S ribosomal protein L15 [Thermosulfuriphilus ammonigenes]|uniref:Large ribosomal subunit protein uL15 n=1 Tax=Thermosulfuriphilus ammonigenes TaxID=1936021 RepID=A0A6G7PYY5_9BACT|nr:50S ribosomal protein L15 [Thermosulfuriphilus ammonigenes]